MGFDRREMESQTLKSSLQKVRFGLNGRRECYHDHDRASAAHRNSKIG